MKKFLIFFIILITTNLFASSEPIVKQTERILHILSGKIDNKYPITMYLTIHDKIDLLSGNYYYNNQGKIIYLEPANLDNNSNIILKETNCVTTKKTS